MQSTDHRFGDDFTGDRRLDFSMNWRIAIEPRLPRVASGLPAPLDAEGVAVPADDGVVLNKDKSVLPAIPEAAEPNSEVAIGPVKPRPVGRSVEDGKLLAKGEVLGDESGAETKAARSIRPKSAKKFIVDSVPASWAGCKDSRCSKAVNWRVERRRVREKCRSS